MRKVWRLASVPFLLSCSLVGGASFGAEESGEKSNYAQFTLVKGERQASDFVWEQTYSFAHDPHCKSRKKLARYAKKKSDKEKPVRVPAGTLTLVYAETEYSDLRIRHGTEWELSSEGCVNRVHFTPKSGGRYRIEQDSLGRDRCTMSVIDLDTGRSPEDLVQSTKPKCTYIAGMPIE